MGITAVFGITSDGLNLAVSLLLLFLLVFYVALIYWTYADARRRIADPLIVGCATAASLFPFVGTLVYMIVRPPEYLEDVRERQLEITAAEARLASVEQKVCPYCSYDVEGSFLRCPSCLRRLKEPCGTCGKPLDPRWPICPYCEAEVGQRGNAPERRPRRERPPAEARRGGAGPAAASAQPAREPPRQGRAEQRPAGPPPATKRRQRPAPTGDRPTPANDRPAPATDRPPPTDGRSAARGRPPTRDRPPPANDRPAPAKDRSTPPGSEPRGGQRTRP